MEAMMANGSKNSLIAKVLALGLIVGILMFFLILIHGVIQDRQHYRDEAIASISSTVAGDQTVIGPFLHASCVETAEVRAPADPEKDDSKLVLREQRREFMLTALPESLDIQGKVTTETRYRGMHSANVFNASPTIQATWSGLASLQPVAQMKNSRMQCGSPILMIGVNDPRGIRKAQLKINGEIHKLKGGTFHPVYKRGVHVQLTEGLRAAVSAQNPLRVELELELAGTQQLALAPVGDTTSVTLSSNWPHPSFGGSFAPSERNLMANGFKASWRLSSIATNMSEDIDKHKENLQTLSIDFMSPINAYTLSDRATKYGLLFVTLTLVAVAMFEIMRNLRVHPIQYFLVGSAISIFFLLLVSLSEHWGFDRAYLAAASACVLLLTYYASHILQGLWRGLPFGAGIGLLYGLLFVLLQLEQTALVVGSIALFVVLALVMVLTRKIDWYSQFARVLPDTTLPSKPQPPKERELWDEQGLPIQKASAQ
jgi:inner membrane protein